MSRKFVRPLFDGLDREQFVVVLLNAKHRPIGTHVVSIGSLTASVVHPRETFKCAVAGNAEAIFICHNHPSGSPEPSPEDIEITERLARMWRSSRHPPHRSRDHRRRQSLQLRHVGLLATPTSEDSEIKALSRIEFDRS